MLPVRLASASRAAASNASPVAALPIACAFVMCDTPGGDSGGIVDIGHINLNIGSADAQAAALAFYVQALGLTRDPEAMTGSANMWINIGSSQFHLPSRQPKQCHRGTVGLVLPSRRDAMLQRLQRAGAALEGTHFNFDEAEEHVNVCCPFGNRLRLHPPSSHLLGTEALGMAYIEFPAAANTTRHIARFYTTVLGAHVAIGGSDSSSHSSSDSSSDSSAHAAAGPSLRVLCGAHQALIFRETALPLPAYDGYHIMLTLADFPAVYRRLADLQLITRGSLQEEEYRFTDIVDLDSGSLLFHVEHECRSTRHPRHGRPLVNSGAAAAEL
jgi:hypothetical protein